MPRCFPERIQCRTDSYSINERCVLETKDKRAIVFEQKGGENTGGEKEVEKTGGKKT